MELSPDPPEGTRPEQKTAGTVSVPRFFKPQQSFLSVLGPGPGLSLVPAQVLALICP